MGNWDFFDKFEDVVKKYMPASGEGETMASQIVTAVNKLVYKWFNDGDVYDNTYGMDGWANDLSSYANWLAKNVPQTQAILDGIEDCYDDDTYEEILMGLAELCLNDEWLEENWAGRQKSGTIYKCDGRFEFREYEDDDEDEWEEDYDEEEDWE